MTRRALLPLTVALGTGVSAQTASPAPKAQTPPDKRAPTTTNAIEDPERKLAALRQFLQDYPASTRKDAAHDVILTGLQVRPHVYPSVNLRGYLAVHHSK